jgi:hypothetical protein
MKITAVVISVAALLVILGAGIMVFAGTLSHQQFVVYTNISTLAWFLASALWLAPKKVKS